MDVGSARTLPPDLMDQTAGSCVNLVADNPWRLPVPKTSKAKFETIDKTDPLELFGNQFGNPKDKAMTHLVIFNVASLDPLIYGQQKAYFTISTKEALFTISTYHNQIVNSAFYG